MNTISEVSHEIYASFFTSYYKDHNPLNTDSQISTITTTPKHVSSSLAAQSVFFSVVIRSIQKQLDPKLQHRVTC